MLPSPRTEWASVETAQQDRDAGLDGEANVGAGEVEPVGQPVHLERDAVAERHLDHPLEIECVRRPVVEDAALRLGEASHGRM